MYIIIRILLILILFVLWVHPNLNAQIRPDFVLSEFGHAPRILIDYQNQIHVVWHGGHEQLYHCILDSIGEMILQPKSFAKGRFLDISRSHHFISIAWQVANPFGNPEDIFVRTMTNEGDSLAGNVKAGAGGGANVAFLTDSTQLVVWVTNNFYGDSEIIMGQKLSSNGYFIGTCYQITDTISERNILSVPDIDNSLMGESSVVVWCEKQASSTSIILGKILSQTGEPKSSTIQISERMATGANSYPVVAVMKQGQFAVAWSEMNHDSIWEIHMRRYDADGISMGEIGTINETQAGPYSFVDISANENGECVIVWNGDRDGQSVIMAQRLNGDGTCLGNNFCISTRNDTNKQYEPSVFLQNDNIYIVWEEIRVLDGATLESKIWANIYNLRDSSLDVRNDYPPLVPRRMKLFPNFPNPFNGTTQIQYKLHHPCKMTLIIYSVSGRKIKSLLNTEQPSGIYKVTWNGKDSNEEDVSSGMYYLQLRSGNEVETNKIILMR